MLRESTSNKYESRVQGILVAVALYTIIPFLIISQYNRPAADDYIIAAKYSQHSLGYLIKDTYLNWSGRYFASLISSLDPIIYNAYQLYKLFPVVLIISFVIAVFCMVKEFTGQYLNYKQILALSSLIIYVYMAAVPSSSEAFYWYPSACIYHLANVFFMLLLIQLNKLQKHETSIRKIFHFAFAAFLTILIIGSNEISMIITLFSIFLFTLTIWLGKREKIKWFILLCLIGIAASAFASFSPGNLKRLKDFQLFTQSTIWTITGAGGITVFYFLQWALLILISSLVYIPCIGIPLAKKFSSDKIVIPFSLKKFVLLLAALILFLQVFAIWFAGGSNLGRIENVIYLFFVLAYFFSLQLFLNHLNSQKKNFFPANNIVYLIGVIAFVVSVVDLNNNITTGYIDLISGKAFEYNKELQERDEIVKLCKADTCCVPPLKNIPKTIFFTDIKSLTEDPINLWINQDYSNFMHSGFVVTSTPLPPLKSNLETIKNTGKKLRGNFFKY